MKREVIGSEASIIEHLYILAAILLTVYGQLILKWQVNSAGPLPNDVAGKTVFLLRLMLNPWVLSGFAGAFAAALAWMATLSKFDLSYAYPFMSLSFVLVFILSVTVFHEAFSVGKCLGLLLIMLGIVVSGRG